PAAGRRRRTPAAALPPPSAARLARGPYLGDTRTVTDDAALRVSDADREGAALALRDAAADGRLTLDELTERLDGAYGAKTRDDLDRVLHDLQARTAPQPPSTRPRRRWVLAVMGGTNLRG